MITKKVQRMKITRCPTAYAAESTGTTSPEDRIKLREHTDRLEWARRADPFSGIGLVVAASAEISMAGPSAQIESVIRPDQVESILYG